MVALLTTQLLDFFSKLKGATWIGFYFLGLFIATVGVSLVFYAKLPLYRQRRFFTFGTKPIPEHRRKFYRWGYWCVVLAAALLLCLRLAAP